MKSIKKIGLQKNKNSKKGITLISLVVTIIILIILAGVSINLVLGNNGLIQQAKTARDKYKNAQDEEERSMQEFEDEIWETQTNITIEQVTDSKPGELEDEDGVKVINSIEDLVFFANDVREGHTYEGMTVKLGVNLDFKLNKSYVEPNRTDYSKYGYEGNLKNALTTGEGFKTIGVNTNASDRKDKSFNGTFDGNGKVIRNLKINNTLENSTEDLRIGLFGNNYGIIKNIGIDNCNIEGNVENENTKSIMVGGIAGANMGTIECSYVSGSLAGQSNSSDDGGFTIVGGISGQISYGGKICNCLANCELDVNGYKICTGGICGRTASLGENENRIENCFSNSLISTFSPNKEGFINVGGIVGITDGGSQCTTKNSFAVTKIIDKTNQKHGCYGGICGCWQSDGEINHCCTGNITIDGTGGANGGICGAIGNSSHPDNFDCVDCSYYSLGIDKYSSYDKFDLNLDNRVVDKESLPEILDIVGEEFKKLPSGLVVLNWQ